MCEEVLESSCALLRHGSGGGYQEEEGQEEGLHKHLAPALAEDCLKFVAAVLSVAADAQQLSVLDLGAGGGQQVGEAHHDSTPTNRALPLTVTCRLEALALFCISQPPPTTPNLLSSSQPPAVLTVTPSIFVPFPGSQAL